MIAEPQTDAEYIREKYLMWRQDGYVAETALRWARSALRYHRDEEAMAAIGLRRHAAWSVYKGAYYHSWSLSAEAHGIPGVGSLDQPCVYVADDLAPFRRCQMYGHDAAGAERWFWVSIRKGAVRVVPCEEPAWARKRREKLHA
jgi:hypothetical protein